MPRPALELADIFRQHGAAYRQARRPPRRQLRVMRAIQVCRTAALGGHVEQCSQCAHIRVSYNSCRNRHCPKCQNAERARWLESRQAELLPVEYFHVVFTLPQPIAAIAFYNQEVVYGILFHCAAQTLLTIARDPRHRGARIGFFALLHTWGQNLLYHPHLHCVVAGGGLSPDETRWIACPPGFFLPVRVLSSLFRRLFLEALQRAYASGALRWFGPLASLQDATHFARYLAPLRQTEWVVYAKPPFGGPHQALAYLSRYTHRVAISNQRLLALENGQVTFQWKDYRHRSREKSRQMTIAAAEFIRRFLLHTLPDRFPRIRHFGFLANRHRRSKLERCRRLLLHPMTDLLPEPAICRRLCQDLKPPPPRPCPRCGKGTMIRVACLPAYRWPWRPPAALLAPQPKLDVCLPPAV